MISFSLRILTKMMTKMTTMPIMICRMLHNRFEIMVCILHCRPMFVLIFLPSFARQIVDLTDDVDDGDVGDDDEYEQETDDDDEDGEVTFCYLAIHDKEPYSGEPERMDTHIIGVYHTLTGANRGCSEYIGAYFDTDSQEFVEGEENRCYLTVPYEHDEGDDSDSPVTSKVYVTMHVIK